MTPCYRSYRCASGYARIIFAWIVLSSLLLTAPGSSIAPARTPRLPTTDIVPDFQSAGRFETTFLPDGVIYAPQGGELWVGKSSDGINRSTNGGFSWVISQPANIDTNSLLAFSPAYAQDGNVFIGAVSNYEGTCFYYSRDRGQTWHTSSVNIGCEIQDIKLSPAYPSDHVVYAVAGGKVLFRSEDGGISFILVPTPSITAGIRELLLSPDFATSQDMFTRLSDYSVWRSSDGGYNWQRIDTMLPGNVPKYVFDLETVLIDETPALLAAWSGGVAYSLDSGDNWVEMDLPAEEAYIVKLAAAYLPNSNTTEIWALENYDPLYGYNQKLLYHTGNLGQPWNTFSLSRPVSSMAFSPANDQGAIFYVLASQALWQIKSNGDDWQLISSVPPRPDQYYDYDQLELVKSPDYTGVSHLFAYPTSIFDGYQRESSAWFLRSLTNGITWEILPLPITGAPVNMVVAPTYPNPPTVFACIAKSLYRSDDAGVSWSLIAPIMPFMCDAIDISPEFQYDQTIYAGGYEFGVFRSVDGGASWSRLVEMGTPVYGVDFSPTYGQDNTIFINASGGIYRSQDGGQYWDSIGMAGMALAISPNFAADGTLFAGNKNSTAGELFRSRDRGNTWEELTGFSPYNFFHTIELSPDYARDQTLVIGIDCRPLTISEDGGETWFEMTQIPTICGYRSSADIVLTHQGGYLQPVVSAPYRVFTYHWPQNFEIAPTSVVFPIQLGNSAPVQQSITLQSEDGAGARWEVVESPSWTTTTPISGTLPGLIYLSVDPSALTNNPVGDIILEAHWSQNQVASLTARVNVFFYTHQVFLPHISH